ncbi:hypothetical protein HYV44_03110 [Candidatus Microgenomates bacterium]|nr:hypothetical protein [Candidatus Microgenomates bacterium]
MFRKTWDFLKNNFPVWLKNLLVFSILAIIMIGIFRFGNALAVFLVFRSIAKSIAFNSGLPDWIAYLMAIPPVAMLAYGMKMSFSFSAKKRRIGYALLCGFFFVPMMIMGFISKDHVYYPDGRPAKCYAATLTGYEYVSCEWKVHPVFGTAVKPVVPDIIHAIWAQERQVPAVERIVPTKDTRFYTTDGQPLIWFYQRPDGRIELFGRPGYHPQFGNVQLQPATSEIVLKIFEHLEKEERNMVIFSNDSKKQDEISSSSTRELQKLRDLFVTIGGDN